MHVLFCKTNPWNSSIVVKTKNQSMISEDSDINFFFSFEDYAKFCHKIFMEWK